MENLEKDTIIEEKASEEKASEEKVSEEKVSEEKVSEETLEEAKDEALDETLEDQPVEEEKTDELPPMDPIVEVQTVYDYRTLKYCNMYIIKVKRKSALIYSVMAAICFIVGLICFFTMEGINKYISIIIIALGLWTLKNLFTEEAKIDKSLENFFRTHAPFKQNFAFDREKIRVTAYVDGEVKQADYPWAYIQEIHAIPEFFILFLNGGTPVIIDRDESKLLLGTKEDLEQIIREQSTLKPFNSYDKPLVKNLKEITYIEEEIKDPVLEENKAVENKEEQE